MAMGIDRQIQARMALGQDRLQQEYAQTQQLIDLLALQKLSKEKAEAARAIQASMQTNPATVKDQLEQQAIAANREGIAAMMPGIQMQGQRMAQAQARSAAGIPSQPAPNMARMAGGGIVAFQEGGMPRSDAESIAYDMIAIERQMGRPDKTEEELRQLDTRRMELNARMANDPTGNLRADVYKNMDVIKAGGADRLQLNNTIQQVPSGGFTARIINSILDYRRNKKAKEKEDAFVGPTEDMVKDMYDGGVVGYKKGDLVEAMEDEVSRASTEIIGVDGQGNPIRRNRFGRIIAEPGSKQSEYYNPRENYTVRNIGTKPRVPAGPSDPVAGVAALLESMRNKREEISPEEVEEKDVFVGPTEDMVIVGYDEQDNPITQSQFDEMMAKIPGTTQTSDTEEIPWYRQRKPDERSLRDTLMGIIDKIPSPEELFGEDPRAAGAAARERFFPTRNEDGVLEIPITSGQLASEESPTPETPTPETPIKEEPQSAKKRKVDYDKLVAWLTGAGGQTSVAGALGGGARAAMALDERRASDQLKREGLQLQRDELEMRRDLAKEETRLRTLADLYPNIAAEAEAAWGQQKAKLEKEAGKGWWDTNIFWRSEAEAIEAQKIQFMNDYMQDRIGRLGLGGEGTTSETIQDFSSYIPS